MRRLSGYGPSLIVLLTASVVLFAGPRAVRMLTYERTRTQIIQARHNLESNDVLERMNQAYRDIASIVEPSVVHISARYRERDGQGREFAGLSTGSGWVFDEQGHIVTNHHVVMNAERIDVQLHNGSVREAELIGADPSTDIAVLKISPGLLHPAQLAPLDEPVSQGDLVFAFGSPFDFRFSMSAGVVSGKDRSVGVLRDESGRRWGYENFIQVDAAVNPGNSGGPLTDYRGRVIGMNTAIATGGRRFAGGFDEGQFAGIGLAIPLDMIYPAVTQLIKSGFVEKGFLGVNVPLSAQDNDTRLATIGFGGKGVVITGVQAQQVAELAGLRANDVVTQINGRPISSVPQLQSIISSMRPGETARLTVWRMGQEQSELVEISVPLAKLDLLRASGQLPPDQPRDSLIALGIARMATNTAKIAQAFDAPYYPGVMIEEIVPSSRLSRFMGNGTTITKVNDVRVRDVDEFLTVLRGANFNRHVVFVEGFDATGEPVIARLQLE